MLTTALIILAVGMTPEDWYTFAPEGKNFRVELPSKPEVAPSRPSTNSAGPLQVTSAQLKTSGATYSIRVAENRGRVDPNTLEDGIRRFATGKKTLVGAIKTIAVGGNPAREFETTERSDQGQVRSKSRWIASGNSLFILTAAGKPGATVPADADRFLGSLKIGEVNPADASGGQDSAAADGETVASTKPPFTIQLPAAAQTVVQTTPGPKGVTKQSLYSCKINDSLYEVKVISEPELVRKGAEKAALDRLKADYLRSPKAAPTDEARLELNAYVGVEFTTKVPGPDGKKLVESRVRMYVIDGVFVILKAISAPDSPMPEAAESFFRSFKPGDAGSDKVDVASDDEPKSKDDDKTKPKAAEKKAPTNVTLSRIPRRAKAYPRESLEDLKRSFVDTERDGFRDVGPAGSVLVGVRASFIEHFGGMKVRSVQPIFRSGKTYYGGQIHGEVVPPVATIVAKPGYAVGGLVSHTGLTVDGFGIVFMKVDGDRLDPTDTYNSPWIGDKKGGGPGEVGTKGGLVVGLQGRSGAEVYGLGLTSLK